MTCMWSEQNLLDNPDVMISVQDGLGINQRLLVLLGNANELLSQIKKVVRISQLVDRSLEGKHDQDSPQAGDFLSAWNSSDTHVAAGQGGI